MLLSFDHLRERNLERCVQDFKHPLVLWSPLEWGGATAGEVGEGLNICKKILRIKTGMAHLNTKPQEHSPEFLRYALADEISDAVIYCDLWAASQEIDLAMSIVRKFNADSRKHEVRTYLGDGL